MAHFEKGVAFAELEEFCQTLQLERISVALMLCIPGKERPACRIHHTGARSVSSPVEKC